MSFTRRHLNRVPKDLNWRERGPPDAFLSHASSQPIWRKAGFHPFFRAFQWHNWSIDDRARSGAVWISIFSKLSIATACERPHIDSVGRKLTQTAGRSGFPKSMQRTPAGLPPCCPASCKTRLEPPKSLRRSANSS